MTKNVVTGPDGQGMCHEGDTPQLPNGVHIWSNNTVNAATARIPFNPGKYNLSELIDSNLNLLTINSPRNKKCECSYCANQGSPARKP